MNQDTNNRGTGRTSSPPSGSASTDFFEPIDFDRRKRTEAIRQNEELERERRRKRLAAQRRAERIRRARIRRFKALCMLAVVAVGVLCIVIALVTMLFRAIFSGNDKDKASDGSVSAEETTLIGNFLSCTDSLYINEESSTVRIINAFLDDTLLSVPSTTDKISEFAALSRRLGYRSNGEAFAALKDAVRDAPMYSNGYIWTEMTSIRSSETGGYFYDTDTSYISAVANICLWEGDGMFLSQTDATTEPKLDISGGMTVLQKLEAAIDYLFRDTTERGLKYDELSGLVYIHTEDNDGTSQGYGSNPWYNFRFGYLDAYANLSFNRAMNDLSALYTLLGETEKSEKYSAIARKNAAAFNEKFWDSSKGRYIGCIDKNGEAHDYGFVFLNLEAVEAGLADSEKADSILSWINGERTIEGDTAVGSDISPSGSLVRNTTRAAEDKWWDYLGGKLPLSSVGTWGQYYQNGGYSLSTAYYDFMARYKNGRSEQALLRMKNLLNDYSSGGLALSNGPSCRVSGDALAGLTPTAYVRVLFGLETDGFRICLSPDFSLVTEEPAENTKKGKAVEPTEPTVGLRSIEFAHNRYGALFVGGTVYLTADKRSPVRFRIAGFEPNASYDTVAVENGFEISRTTVTADENGELNLAVEFGAESYLKIEKTPTDEKNNKK